MKTRSAKSKGRRLQNEVKQFLRERFIHDGLVDGDIETAIMGQSGTDIKLSPTAEKIIPFDIECKNQEKINIWQSISQAESNTKPNRIPMVIFRKNNTKTYCVIEMDQLFNLLFPKKDVEKT